MTNMHSPELRPMAEFDPGRPSFVHDRLNGQTIQWETCIAPSCARSTQRPDDPMGAGLAGELRGGSKGLSFAASGENGFFFCTVGKQSPPFSFNRRRPSLVSLNRPFSLI